MPLMVVFLLASNTLTLINASFHEFLYEKLADLAPPTWTKSSMVNQKKLIRSNATTLTKRIRKRTAKGIARNITASFGEAVPYIGISVVVSSIAWDLKDACDDMKDMDELLTIFNSSSDDETKKVCGMKAPNTEELKNSFGDKLDQIKVAVEKFFSNNP
jgi:hypothetical protein